MSESSQSPHLDKVFYSFIEEISSRNGKPLYEISPEEAREFLSNIQNETYGELNAEVQDVEIPTEEAGDVSVRLVRPVGKFGFLPLIIYCHGGGWVMGNKKDFDMTIKTIAINTGATVAFVEYSKSPEAKYPTAINQIYGVLKYLVKNGEEYSIDGSRVSIVGDSAGGNMAAVVAMKCKNNEEIKLASQVLLYPVTDAQMSSHSYEEFENGPWLSKKAMEYFFDAYLPNNIQRDEVCVSPLKAQHSDLEGLPATLVITAENDVLRDEGEAFARKLIEAGVNAVSVRINNTCHDFILLNALRESCAVKTAYKLIAGFLKESLQRET